MRPESTFALNFEKAFSEIAYFSITFSKDEGLFCFGDVFLDVDAVVADDEAGLEEEAAVVALIRLLSFFRFGILLFQLVDLIRLLQLHRCLCADCLQYIVSNVLLERNDCLHSLTVFSNGRQRHVRNNNILCVSNFQFWLFWL